MRKNYIYEAVVPETRNEFIKFISAEKEAIAISNTLLQELTKEINSTLSDKKNGSFFKKLSVPMVLLSWNPIGWVMSGITFLAGTFLSASDHFKKYIIYAGVDASDNQIIVFHHKKKVDLKYDKVNYPSFVKGINYKKTNQKVKKPSNPCSEQTSSKASSVNNTNNKYLCEVRLFTKEEGGRAAPIFSNYMPVFTFKQSKTTGTITLPDDVECCSPGESACVTVSFREPLHLTAGDHFSISDNGKTVGTGTVVDSAD